MPDDKPSPPPAHLSELEQEAWRDLVYGGETTAELVMVEAAAKQLARARDASRRINAEGLIVEGQKGAAVPHPALAVERAAQAEVRHWAQSQPRRPTRR